MPSHNEAQRLAAMANALRPDWPARSVLSILERDHTAQPFQDLAVALAFVATDPATKTPARLAEPGPWWNATLATPSTPDVGPGRAPRCEQDGHWHERAANCRLCASERLAPTPDILRTAPTTEPPQRRPMPRVPDPKETP